MTLGKSNIVHEPLISRETIIFTPPCIKLELTNHLWKLWIRMVIGKKKLKASIFNGPHILQIRILHVTDRLKAWKFQKTGKYADQNTVDNHVPNVFFNSVLCNFVSLDQYCPMCIIYNKCFYLDTEILQHFSYFYLILPSIDHHFRKEWIP